MDQRRWFICIYQRLFVYPQKITLEALSHRRVLAKLQIHFATLLNRRMFSLINQLTALDFSKIVFGLVLDSACQTSNRLIVIWILGHSELEESREANFVAKKDRDQPVVRPKPVFRILSQSIKKAINILLNQWHKS